MSLRLEGAGIRIDGRWLVRDASLEILPGRVTALVGPNGSGKSTVLRLLAGLWRPTEGRATIGDQGFDGLTRRELARRITFVPQDTRVDFAFTVRDIVAMGRHPHLGRFESPTPVDAAAIEAAIERADIGHLADRLVNELSGGERQRVLIARSLATQAEVILLDEPTSSLDVDHTLDTLALLRELTGEGKAVALALHDLNAVARWADYAGLLNEGDLQAFGPVHEVLREELVEPVFSVQVERLHSARGAKTLVFHRRNGERTGSESRGRSHLEQSPIHEIPRQEGELKKIRVQDGQLFICQGCCCGRTDRGFTAIPLDEFKQQWKDRSIRRRFHLTISGCLGPCDMANVVLVNFRGQSTWLHSINDPEDVTRIYDYVEEMLFADRWLPPPDGLRQRHFQRYLADSIDQLQCVLDR